MSSFNWTCPYCGRPVTITEPNHDIVRGRFHFDEEAKYGFLGHAILCPNPKCGQVTLTAKFGSGEWPKGGGQWQWRMTLGEWRLLPESEAKPQPDYIPEPICENYYEACRIRDLSPKASATLARRCLQGMIRDFWKVDDKPNLFQEIDAIKDRVDLATWEAINGVRSVGNIGAHMEKDINVIVDVDPGEAQALIELIEFLFGQWYVRRHEDKIKVARVKAIAQQKASDKGKGAITEPAEAIPAVSAGGESDDTTGGEKAAGE